MKVLIVNTVFLGVMLLASSGIAQTTLPGGSDVDGSFAVGNSTNKGGLNVTGQTGNTAAPGISVTGDGGVVFTGTYGTGAIPAVGGGVRMMWYPKKGAFRAGSPSATSWDDVNIGAGSVAFGNATTASGPDSLAFGNSSIASSFWAVAGGFRSMATGGYSLAMGMSAYAAGAGDVAFGSSDATGGYAFSAGSGIASGYSSVAFGSSTASAQYAVASGWQSIAAGYNSSASGFGVTAASAYSAVFGRYNIVEGNSTTWVQSDPLFVIGNGTGLPSDPAETRNRNALVVYKNGKIKMDRQGDILMGEFGNPE